MKVVIITTEVVTFTIPFLQCRDSKCGTQPNICSFEWISFQRMAEPVPAPAADPPAAVPPGAVPPPGEVPHVCNRLLYL